MNPKKDDLIELRKDKAATMCNKIGNN